MAAVKPEADEAGFEGAYDCLMCFTSCRQQPALHCTACTWNPWHVACAAGTQFERVCPQCGQESVAPWKRGKFTTLQQSGECVDLVAEEEAAEERQREREREESVRKRELEERQRELASLFAQSIKQPKVPAGEPAVGGSSTSTSSGSGWQRRPASQPPSSATHNAQGTEPDSRWHAPCR